MAGTVRLRGRGAFERAFGRGRAVASPLVVVRVAPGADGPSRVAVAAGRRLGGAVVRNRVRRRWREVVRRGPAVAAGWDVILVVRAGSVSASPASLRSAWVEVLGRARLAPRPAR